MSSILNNAPVQDTNNETIAQPNGGMVAVVDERPNIEEGGNEPTVRASWRSLFKFTTRAHYLPLCFGLLLSIGSGIIIPALAVFLGMVFNSFTDFGAGRLSGSGLVSKVSQDAIYLVGLGSASWLLNGSYFMFWLVFGELQAKSVRDKLFDGMLQKDMEWYDLRKAGVSAMIPRLQTQMRELQIATSQPLGFAVQYTVTTFAALGLALYTAWSLTLVTLATVPISAVFLAWISARIQPAITAQTEQLTQAAKLANNSIMSIDTVKCFNGQDFEIWQYATAIKKAAKCYLVQANTNAVQIGFVRLVILGMFVQGFWFGSHLVVTGQKSPGQILTAFWACLMATQTVEQLLPQLLVLEKGRTAAATLEAVLKKIQKGRRISRLIGCKTPGYCDGDIQVRHISFAYPARPEQLALNNASFFFPAGETTFVVGKSGSGKSTLGNLLLHFYSPVSGDISIDGESIQVLDTNWIRNNITLVQQQSVLFNETIFKNIAFGRRDHARVRKEEVKRCLETAALQNTVRDLPKGLETLVGNGGSAMSGGQKQRVAIARARLRDTPILILDEATSALDHISRAFVMDAIRKWRKGKTTIIITHDISQIQDEDYAYVLDGGLVVQEGYRNALDQIKTGPFAAFSLPGIAFPNKALDNVAQVQRRYSKALPSTLASPHPSTDSRDSIDVQVLRRKTLIPSVYSPLSNQDYSKRRTESLISPLSPVFGHMHRWSNARQSVLPYHNISRPVNVLRQTPVSSPIELDEIQTLCKCEDPPPPPKKDEWNKRPSLPSLIEPKDPLKIPLLRSISSRKKRKYTPAEQARRIASLRVILATVWPRLTLSKRIILVLGFFFAFLHAAATPVFSFVFSKLLATFFLPNGAQMALMWSLSVLGVAIGDATASYFMHYLLEICGQAWVDTLRVEAMKRIMDQPRPWFDRDKNSLSHLTECLDRNAEEMRNLVGRFAGFVFVAVVMMTVGIVWSLIVCWKLTLVGLSSAPLLYGITRGFNAVSNKWEGKSNDAGEAAGAIFTETFGNIRTVRALTLEAYFHRKYSHATKVALNVGFRRAAYSGFFFGLSDAGIIFVTALIFYYGAMLAASGAFSTSNIIIVFTMLLFSISNANAIVAFIPQINSSRDTATRLLRLANLPFHVSHEHSGRLRLAYPGPIVFKNLSFAYPSRPSYPVLTNLTLTLPIHTTTALVGSSGSGKSTLASLLLALYPVAPGTLSIGYHSISDLHIPSLRASIATVPQSPTLFATSIAKNITYGLSETSILATHANVREAASQAGIDTFIASLPNGYETLVGDGGVGLSGGQVQRIGIARALVRKPRLLILDEPTSSLDSVAAEGIREVLRGLMMGGDSRAGGRMGSRTPPLGKGGAPPPPQGKEGESGVTILVMTHSWEMMRACGWVVVMKEGVVGEEGTWDQLIGREGGELRRLLGRGEGVG